jgi:hypothetical protein
MGFGKRQPPVEMREKQKLAADEVPGRPKDSSPDDRYERDRPSSNWIWQFMGYGVLYLLAATAYIAYRIGLHNLLSGTHR